MHLKEKRFSCSQCGFKTMARGKLLAHEKTKHRGTWYGCEFCDYRTKTETALSLHISLDHNNSRNIVCTLCDFKTVSTGMLNRHLSSKHTEDSKKPHFSCGQCEFRTLIKMQLEKHKRYSHISLFETAAQYLEISDKRFNCALCHKIFKQKKKCIRHIKEEHLGIKFKPDEGKKQVDCFKCKNLISKKGMKRHLEKNCSKTNVKAVNVYSCHLCVFTSSLKIDLLKHKKTSHKSDFIKASVYCEMIDDTKAKCTICLSKFSRQSYCIRHVKEDHLGMKVKEISGKTITNCPICSTSCSRKGLKRHVETHAIGNTFICKICDSSFTRMDGLKRHLKNIHQ